MKCPDCVDGVNGGGNCICTTCKGTGLPTRKHSDLATKCENCNGKGYFANIKHSKVPGKETCCYWANGNKKWECDDYDGF